MDELKQLLGTAKHPETIALLQKAVSDVESGSSAPLQNGQSNSSVAAEKVDAQTRLKPIMRSKETSLNMTRITNYGEVMVVTALWW